MILLIVRYMHVFVFIPVVFLISTVPCLAILCRPHLRLAVLTVLRLEPNSLGILAPVCSSMGFLAASLSKRSFICPLGDRSQGFVSSGNLLALRPPDLVSIDLDFNDYEDAGSDLKSVWPFPMLALLWLFQPVGDSCCSWALEKNSKWRCWIRSKKCVTVSNACPTTGDSIW